MIELPGMIRYKRSIEVIFVCHLACSGLYLARTPRRVSQQPSRDQTDQIGMDICFEAHIQWKRKILTRPLYLLWPVTCYHSHQITQEECGKQHTGTQPLLHKLWRRNPTTTDPCGAGKLALVSLSAEKHPKVAFIGGVSTKVDEGPLVPFGSGEVIDCGLV